MMTYTVEVGQSTSNMATETPMTVIDTVWEPHTIPVAYLKPSTLTDTPSQSPPAPTQPHKSGLVHSVHTHLPWHQHAHGAPPAVCPETDIRETAQAYHIEIALAGVSDPSSVSIEWRAPRSLVVCGGVTSDSGRRDGAGVVRPPPEETFRGLLKKIVVNGDGGEMETAKIARPDEHVGVEGCTNGDVHHKQSLFILKERRTGWFQRKFTLPVDIDGEGCRARLEHGLLRIDILKSVPQQKEDEAESLIGLHDDEVEKLKK